jgi:NADH-quinone oxidoreductase subunit B
MAAEPGRADVLVVSGTLTDRMAPAIKRLYDELPGPTHVISFGACANCGGPYWDSYSVTKGVDQLVPVDVYVPGCPPRPEALLHGLLRLRDKLAPPAPRRNRAYDVAALTAPLVRPPGTVQ